MQPDIKKDEIFTVKIYFINLNNLISIITDTLIKLNFETYIIDKEDRGYLISILNRNIRNIIFIYIRTESETKFWIEYIDKLLKIQKSFIQIGIFVYKNIEKNLKVEFLIRGVSVIPFSDIKKNTLSVVKKVLKFYEAKGKRKFIRAKALAKSEVYFTFKNITEAIRCVIIDISISAFSAQISNINASLFKIGTIYPNTQLVIKGDRVLSSVKLIGFSKENPEIFIFKFQNETIIDDKTGYIDGLSEKNRNKVYKFIQMCLKKDLEHQLTKARNQVTI